MDQVNEQLCIVCVCLIGDTELGMDCMITTRLELLRHGSDLMKVTLVQVVEAPQMNYAALDFSSGRVRKGTMKALPRDTLYSEVRAEAPNQR